MDFGGFRISSDSFTILGLWVLGLATSNINESSLQTNESKTLFLMTSLPYYCIPGLAEIKTYAQKMQDAQVTKSLYKDWHVLRIFMTVVCMRAWLCTCIWLLSWLDKISPMMATKACKFASVRRSMNLAFIREQKFGIHQCCISPYICLSFRKLSISTLVKKVITIHVKHLIF